MEKVKLFYHVTTSLFKPNIIQAQAIIPQPQNQSADWMRLLNPMYKDKIPDGVWFCSTLFNGNLPNKSPYGTQRVKIPIEKVFSQLGSSVNLYLGQKAEVSGNKYIRLMAVKEGDTFECLEHMQKIDPVDNEWMKFTSDTEFAVAKRPVWVEVFFPYKIQVENEEWDTVEELK
ncbi:phytanoyl-CoA hydroxylase-interacting protein-like [Ylistrum balloti]|uniref:phytanoyl-CoA hydroxylase-interacting protein-like n=1 Tax=Ylistrum balloti TaxID=509963 RepID=UPI002905E6C4|nr:phytanoyl-CoA hydroxylase-interacting protein-like [Ylistrum balloti]